MPTAKGDRVRGCYHARLKGGGITWLLRWRLQGIWHSKSYSTRSAGRRAGNELCLRYGWPTRWPDPADLIEPGEEAPAKGEPDPAADLPPLPAQDSTALRREQRPESDLLPYDKDGDTDYGALLAIYALDVRNCESERELGLLASKSRVTAQIATAALGYRDIRKYERRLARMVADWSASREQVMRELRTLRGGRAAEPATTDADEDLIE